MINPKEQDQIINEGVGRKLRLARKRNGFSLRELAAKLGLSNTTLLRYEAGEIAVGAPVLRAICQTLHTDANRLLGLRVPDISTKRWNSLWPLIALRTQRCALPSSA